VGQARPSDFEDGEWIEKPGFPPTDGTWLHPTPDGLPEFEFEEGHDRTKNEPPFRLTIGTHEDAHIRLDHPAIPRRHCMVFKEGRDWYIESLSAVEDVWLGDQRLERGLPAKLKHGDSFSLLQPPASLAYKVEIDEADNWYLDIQSEKDFPNKWPSKMPGHPSEAPPAPEELKRLAWQTDQMRRRSEEDQVRVADWAAFSQYVKSYYHKYGIFAKPWRGSVGPPVPRPPPIGPRAYPRWISEIVATQRMLPYVNREYPFRDALELSGFSVAPPLTPNAPLPGGPVSQWGESNAGSFKSGGTGVMVGDETLVAAAMSYSLKDGEAIAWSGKPSAGSSGGVGGAGGASASGAATGTRGPASGPPAAGAGAGPAASPPAPASPPMPQVTFREWLLGMEDSQFIAQYHDSIAARFDSLAQLADLYVQGGELDERFFEVAGIQKLGHKRIFQKWFRDYCMR